MPQTERLLKSQMKIGAGLALFGLLCPFFWLSAFSGNAGFETWVYGVHSSIFIVLGLVVLGKGWYDLKCIRIKNQIKTSEAGI
ncbi:MAG: hypothetical protein NTZ24_16610 [Deltaproteobacteria bacterium]|nr:hypothetical protein [Deltaproteobacteria bacterium]